MTELRSKKVDRPPPAAPTPKRPKCVAKHSPRQKVNEELGLDFPLDDLLGSEVPKNGQVLRHLSHTWQDERGERDIKEAAKLVIETVKRCWLGANVELACDKTLVNRVIALNKKMRLVE